VISLVQLFWQIATLRARPQDLPDFPVVLLVSLLLSALTLLAGLLMSFPFSEALIRVLAALLLPAALLYTALVATGRRGRFIRSYSAMCGASALIYAIALPLISFSDAGKVPTAVLLILVLLDIWTLIIAAHVLSHTFETGFASGFSLALLMTLITLIVVLSLTPRSDADLQPQVHNRVPDSAPFQAGRIPDMPISRPAALVSALV